MWTRKVNGACTLALLCVAASLPWAAAAPAAEFVVTGGNIPTKGTALSGDGCVPSGYTAHFGIYH